MPETARVLLASVLLAACSSGSHPAAAPAPGSTGAPAPGSAAESPADASLADAMPAVAPASGDIYRGGLPYRPTAPHDDRSTCRATSDAAAACARAGTACALAPPVQYWEGPMHCSGIQRPVDLAGEQKRLDALAIPACQCTCDPGYKAASESYRHQREMCSRVP